MQLRDCEIAKMRYTLKTVAGTFLLLLTSKTALALGLLQAYELAERSDPEIIAASFEYQAILSTRSQSSSTLLPNINLDIYTQKVEQNTNNPASTITDYDNTGYTLSLTQSIYNHDRYLKLEQTDLSIASAAATYDAAKQALILRVAQAYYDVLAANDNLIFAEAEKKAIAQQLEQAKSRFDVGLIAITDVKESQAQYDIAVAASIQAENLLSTTRETLHSITGETAGPLNALAKEIPLVVPQPANINQWVETSKKNNLALKAAEYAYGIASKQIDINRSGHYPSLNLSLTHNDTTQEIDNSSDIDSDGTTISLNLSIPIYSGGLTSAKTREAVFLKDRSRALREKILRDTIKLSRDSYLGVTTTIAQVKAFKQALVSTQSAYEATQAGFEVGTRTTVDVLSVLREQYKAERDYAQTRYNYILNILRLKQAAGTLSRQDVIEVNKWLKSDS